MNESVVFVLCSERGPLERMSALFVYSLRRFGGAFRDAPVYSYSPRLGEGIGSKTRRHFAKLQVDHRQIPLNTEFRDYPLANKPLVLAHAEANLDADVIVFVDSDMLLFSEPSALRMPDQFDIGLRPVDSKGIGVSSNKDREYAYWNHLYRICNLKDITYVETTVDRKRIHGYWNSGLIASKRSEQLYSLWAANFKRVMRSGITPSRGTFFVEQSCLAASVIAAKAKVYELPPSYNYPIHLHDHLLASSRIEKLGEMVTAHYHKMFGADGKFASRNPLASFQNSVEHIDWLENHLDALGIYPSKRWRRFAKSTMSRLLAGSSRYFKGITARR